VAQYISSLQENPAREKDRVASEFSRLTHKQVNAIVQGTNQAVKRLNEELNCFSFEVSTQGLQVVYLLAQTFTTALATNLELIHEA